jgi:hypothetical protein
MKLLAQVLLSALLVSVVKASIEEREYIIDNDILSVPY